MRAHTLPLRTLRCVRTRVTEFEIELLPQRLCISYTPKTGESIPLAVGNTDSSTECSASPDTPNCRAASGPKTRN